MILERSKHSIFWFTDWLDTYDISSGRVIVHLPAGRNRLEKLKPLILEMVKLCEKNGIAIEFHVTDGGDLLPVESSTYPNTSVYSIEGFFNIVPSMNCTLANPMPRDFSHRVVVRRMDVLEIDAIAELSKTDIIMIDTRLDMDAKTGGRWDQELKGAIQQELKDGGLLIRSQFNFDFEPIFSLISTPKISIDESGMWYDVWYDVWQRK